MPRQLELDFLRGLAILAVLDYHASHQVLFYPLHLLGFPPIGWIGVDIFFVLSGFLVGGLLIREWTSTGRIDAPRFLIRRVLKIWPQYYFFLLVVVLTGHQPLRAMWPAFLNIQNYFVAIPHLWTLAVEEHAYILLLVLVLFAARSNVRTRSAFFVIASICASVVTLRLWLAFHHQPFITGTHTRIEGILYGALLALLLHRSPALFQRLQSLRPLWIGALLLALAALRSRSLEPWVLSLLFDAANLVGISLLMLLYRKPGATQAQTALIRFVARPLTRSVAWIGLYSYGIYLWHVSVYAPAARIALYLPLTMRPAFTALAQPLLGIAAGVLITRLVEFPMLRLRERLFPRKSEAIPQIKRTVPDNASPAASRTRNPELPIPRMGKPLPDRQPVPF